MGKIRNVTRGIYSIESAETHCLGVLNKNFSSCICGSQTDAINFDFKIFFLIIIWLKWEISNNLLFYFRCSVNLAVWGNYDV